MLLAPLFLLALSQTWTVDDDGPADFSSLSVAVATVAPGDTLLVMPGSYASVLLTKPLTLVGPAGGPRPKISGELWVNGVASFTLAGLELDNLRLDHVTGRGRVDDCLVNGLINWGFLYTFVITDCSEVEVTRTTANGKQDTSTAFGDGSPGLVIDASRVELVDCALVGGFGNPTTLEAGYGWEGLLVKNASEVSVAGTRIAGGGAGGCSLKGGCGMGAPGIHAHDSAVNVRGSSFQLIQGGKSGSGVLEAAMSGDGITWSGVSTLGSVFTATELDPPEPYIMLGGTDEPGTARRLKLYAPAGSPAVALGSLGPALLAVPALSGGLVWIDPTKIFVTSTLVTVGQDQAATQDYALPPDPAFAGLSALFQAAVLPSAGNPYLTNSSNVVLRF